MSSLVIVGLCKKYDKTTAVDNFSIEVRDGELLAILGPSGCGKSTILSCIAGIEDVDAGRVFLGDRCLFDTDSGVSISPDKRNIGFMFQNYALWPHMTVERNISYPLRVRKLPKHYIEPEVERILCLIRLDDKRKKHPGQLSGGEQQRVALGRALIMKPDLLLLDEPLSNLDAKLREEMQSEIRKIQQKLKLTTIHVTHDQSEALAMSDSIAVMNKGRLIQSGTPSEIYNNPKSKFTAGFVGANNLVDGMITVSDGKKVFNSSDGCITGLPVEAEEMLKNSSGLAACVIRPEDIYLSAERKSAEYHEAAVSERVYRGAHYMYTIDVFGLRLRVQAHSSDRFEIRTRVFFRIGKAVYLPNKEWK